MELFLKQWLKKILNGMNSMLIRIFNKKSISNKSIHDRIEGSYKLIKFFFAMLALHLLILTVIIAFLPN